MAEKGRIVASFALGKSVAYRYFLDKTSKTGRDPATVLLSTMNLRVFAQPARDASKKNSSNAISDWF